MSPLQVANVEYADVVFVAARFETREDNVTEVIQLFLDRAEQTLPYLSIKPQFLALHNPTWVYSKYAGGLFQSTAQGRNFTYVTIEGAYVSATDDIVDNWVTTPYMSHFHWDNEVPHLPPQATSQGVSQGAKRLAFMSAARYLSHMKGREAMRNSCEVNSEHCLYIEWEGEHKSASRVFYEMSQSWFNLMPKGDFMTRNSMYDAIAATSIPIVDVANIITYMPFQDMIDWNLGLLNVFEEESDGEFDIVNWLLEAWDEVKSSTVRQFLLDHRHVMQFSLLPDHSLIDFNGIYQRHPHDDAFTFTWKAVLRNLCQRDQLPVQLCCKHLLPA